MRSTKYQPNDRKITNLSFDFTAYKHRYMPQTTVNNNVKINFSPADQSPRKRFMQEKRASNTHYSDQAKLNSSNNVTNTSTNSKRPSQQKNNLTIKTGSSIEALKEMLSKQTAYSAKSSNLKFLLQLKQEKNQSSEKPLDIRTSDSSERFTDKRQYKKLSATRTNKSSSKEKKLSQKTPSFVLDTISYWSKLKLPLSPTEILNQFPHHLTEYEKIEILQYKKIYCIGISAKKEHTITEFNDGFDDPKGEYLYTPNDHIAYRYEVLEPVGKGSFGQAFKVFDHKKQQIVCLKIIRNKQKFHDQALVEADILEYIREKDEENVTNIVKIKDFQQFRNHVCLVFELLSMNLYELIKSNNFQGLTLELIRRFAIQILNSLNFLYKHRIVHCDLKPENILLKQPNKSGIKIIDFGSSCFENKRIYSYIQSRYYRAPEVIFGLPYESGIDMWSFGCIMAELYIGYPIFPGENEQEQIAYILEMIGMPEQKLIDKSPRRKFFFTMNSPYQALQYTNKRGKIRMPGTKTLKDVLRCNDSTFLDFLSKCFVWDPEKRIKPLEALMHNWILEGLPTEIRSQHVKYLESEQITQKAFFKPHQGDQGDQHHKHHISEPEMNDLRKPTNYSKKHNQLRTLSKDKEIGITLQQSLVGHQDQTPQHKKIVSQSFHTSKNSTIQKQQFYQYFPNTGKNNDYLKKQQYFH